MVDTLELEVILKRKGIAKRELSKKLGISEQGLYNKINNVTEFKPSEIKVIAELLDIPINSVIFLIN